jgi:hypothetical protein
LVFFEKSGVTGVLEGTIVEPPKTLRIKKTYGTEEEAPNPAYHTWIAQDQQLVAYLLNSMTKEILVHVSSCEHVASLWTAVT